ncbi:MAG: PaaI family thioesterase [Phenylobacterium sp.]
MDGGDERKDPLWVSIPITEGAWAGWNGYTSDPFEDLTGPFYWKNDPDGRPRCAFRAEQKHMNGGEFMHGGCVMTFADYAIFVIGREALADSHNVTATFDGQFVGTARVGDLVECTGEVVKAGRSMVFLRGLITNGAEPMMNFSAVIKKTKPRT